MFLFECLLISYFTGWRSSPVKRFFTADVIAAVAVARVLGSCWQLLGKCNSLSLCLSVSLSLSLCVSLSLCACTDIFVAYMFGCTTWLLLVSVSACVVFTCVCMRVCE